MRWLGHSHDGYARFKVGGKQVLVHRFALELSLGRPISPGLFACHACDHPWCANPAHVYEGEHQQNVDDMTSQLRHAWGMKNGKRKLTADDVQEIRRRSKTESQAALAKVFGVHQSAISRVLSSKRWRHLPAA